MQQRTACIVGIDLGTGGDSVVLRRVDDGSVIAFGQGHYGHKDGLADPRSREQEPGNWFLGVIEAFNDLWTKVDPKDFEIVGIGICGHMHAATFLDRHGDVIEKIPNGIMWNDPRGAEEAKMLARTLGWPVPGRLTISRMRHLAGCYPEVWRNAVSVVTVPSAYLGYRLTGEHAVGCGDASGMFGQLDENDQVPGSTLSAVLGCGMPKIFPRIVPAGTPIGYLTEHAAQLLGLEPGIPVAPPEGDQPVGMVASGCLEPGDVSISLGTSVVLNAVGEKPILNKRGLIDSFRTVLSGRHLLMVCVTNGCAAYDAVVKLFQPLWPDEDLPSLRAKLARLAGATAPGADGLILVPFLGPEGSFLETDPFGTLTGMRFHNMSPGHVMRALYEAEALMMLAGFKEMGVPTPRRIVLSGGGSQDPVWPQIIANVFGAPVMKPADAAEAASLGAAHLALFMHLKKLQPEITLRDVVLPRMAYTDVYAPNADITPLYERNLAAFMRVVEATRPLYQV